LREKPTASLARFWRALAISIKQRSCFSQRLTQPTYFWICHPALHTCSKVFLKRTSFS
jgi:hypothetical protein